MTDEDELLNSQDWEPTRATDLVAGLDDPPLELTDSQQQLELEDDDAAAADATEAEAGNRHSDSEERQAKPAVPSLMDLQLVAPCGYGGGGGVSNARKRPPGAVAMPTGGGGGGGGGGIRSLLELDEDRPVAKRPCGSGAGAGPDEEGEIDAAPGDIPSLLELDCGGGGGGGIPSLLDCCYWDDRRFGGGVSQEEAEAAAAYYQYYQVQPPQHLQPPQRPYPWGTWSGPQPRGYWAGQAQMPWRQPQQLLQAQFLHNQHGGLLGAPTATGWSRQRARPAKAAGRGSGNGSGNGSGTGSGNGSVPSLMQLGPPSLLDLM